MQEGKDVALSVGQSVLFEVLKRMPSIIASRLGKWMLKKEYVTVTPIEANIDMSSEAYPFIIYRWRRKHRLM